MDIESFVMKITEFKNMSSSQLIPYFAFYLLTEANMTEVKASDINKCFEDLHLNPYSNISSFLSKDVKKKTAKFIKKKDGYVLNRATTEIIKKELDIPCHIPLTDELIPITLFDNCPYYILENAKQMIRSYECGLYDAALVMMRKLVETLIIECFEKYKIENEIKGNNHFLYLSDLIPKFTSSSCWNISRNLAKNIIQVKKLGDLSAHNRRFIAKKSDINNFRFELRQTIQEIVLIINSK